MKLKYSLLVVALTSLSAHADVNISGFASVNAGKVLNGTGVPQYGVEPTFLADYPIVSAYTEDFSFKPESLIGLQVSAELGEGLSVTGQVVARGADDYNAEFEWAYISYELNDSWTVQAGKKRLPLFYYSDFYDVGYAYVWMRPPADNYTWQIFNYEGINFLYNGSIGDWSMTANIYAGKEDDPNNKLLSDFFFQKPTREIWEDIFGGVATFSKDWLEIRVTHMQYTNRRFIDGEPSMWDGKDSRDGKFYGLAANADFGNFFILSEFNRLDLGGNLDTYMLSAGYRFGNVTPYVMFSDFSQDGDGDTEKHNTKAVGVRWDFHPSAAFKMQYDKVEDESFDLAVAGDSEAITFGVDVVF
ncbi:porin (plasmid) [Pseudoalteromonas xiamenensis]|uniref:porin n=1 Tax=Pseudoalteromonas xiamenensis TaxID=882626 RepID=UPI0027E508C7|nr:porin [Pseudoalteromonas xiamenensis]WMN62173.1 porin [Pseudoalteromonas xiamenensis]